jgi:hypothetical protein
MKKNMIMVLSLVAFVLAPHTFADESLESGGELQRVEEPEGEQVTQEASSQADGAGEGSESEAIDEPVKPNDDGDKPEQQV